MKNRNKFRGFVYRPESLSPFSYGKLVQVFLGMVAISLGAGNVTHAGLILLEDFEDSTITYTTSVPDALGNIDRFGYFGRIAPDTALNTSRHAFTNNQGNGYYGANNTRESSNGQPNRLITLDWSGIDISAFTNLELSWFVAEDDSDDGREHWDADNGTGIRTTRFDILTQLDGGGFNPIFAVRAENAAFDQTPRVDTDFDGVGDGAEITDAFTQYMVSIPDGSILDIRVEIAELDIDEEDIAFDSLRLTGTTAVPEPSSFLFLSLLGLVGTGLRRWRK